MDESGSDDGGSVEVGMKGKIGSLMTRELHCRTHSSSSSKFWESRKYNSLPCYTIPRLCVSEKSLQKARSFNHKSCSTTTPTNHDYEAVMSLNGTCATRGGRTVYAEIVDIKCGGRVEGAWSNRFKKLGFSRLLASSTSF